MAHVLIGEPVPTPDQVRGRLFAGTCASFGRVAPRDGEGRGGLLYRGPCIRREGSIMRRDLVSRDSTPRVYVIHENDAWVEPLRREFETRAIPYAEWFLDA